MGGVIVGWISHFEPVNNLPCLDFCELFRIISQPLPYSFSQIVFVSVDI